MNQPVRKRRFLSFGLRFLLILMLVVVPLSIWTGRRIQRGRHQRAILTQIEAAGRDVKFNNNYEMWVEPSWSNFF